MSISTQVAIQQGFRKFKRKRQCLSGYTLVGSASPTAPNHVMKPTTNLPSTVLDIDLCCCSVASDTPSMHTQPRDETFCFLMIARKVRQSASTEMAVTQPSPNNPPFFCG